jgi:hypothetical protein
MEEILKEFDKRNTTAKKPPLPADQLQRYSRDDLAQALTRFSKALRDVLPLLEQQQQHGDEAKINDNYGVSAQWLLNILEPISSDLGTTQIARLVLEATQNTPEQQEEALFAALGASEEAMSALFEIFPRMNEIRQNVTLKDIGLSEDDFGQTQAVSQDDPTELERQQLRQEAMDAAQVAVLAQAEVDALVASQMSGPSSGATHTIARKSEIELQKAARKAHKRAAQAMQRAKAAGAILDDNELLAIDPDAGNTGQGGLVGHSHDQLLSLQHSLLPEGSRKYYNDQGLPSGTQRYDDDIIGYEKVIIPPPELDVSKLPARVRIDDVMDPECARVFAGTASLNPMQSTVFETAFHRRENMLICAPTGE